MVAEAVRVDERPEGQHRGVRGVRRSADDASRVLGLAVGALRVLAELLPHAVDERVHQPEDRVRRRALDVAHVAADVRVHQAVVGLELRVVAGRDVGHPRLAQHVVDVGVREQVLVWRWGVPGSRVGPHPALGPRGAHPRRLLPRFPGRVVAHGARELAPSVPGAVAASDAASAARAGDDVAGEATAVAVTLGDDAPVREAARRDRPLVVAHVVVGPDGGVGGTRQGLVERGVPVGQEDSRFVGPQRALKPAGEH